MNSPPPVRIGARGSPLSLTQTGLVRDALAAANPARSFEIVPIVTTGDRIQDRRLQDAGGKGLFTKELDEAMLAGRIDLAVHSMKDLPTQLPDDIVLAGVPAREDPRDALICAVDARSLIRSSRARRDRNGQPSPPSPASVAAPDFPDQHAARQCRNAAAQGRRGRHGRHPPRLFRAEAARPRAACEGAARPPGVAAGGRPGRPRHHRAPRRRRHGGGAGAGAGPCDAARNHRRAGISRGAGRVLPHADRRARAVGRTA